MKGLYRGSLLALVAGTALVAACASDLDVDQHTFALSDEEIEDEKEVMCDAYGCETSVERKEQYSYWEECSEYWTRSDSSVCDLETRVISHTVTYTRSSPLFKRPKGDPPKCEYAVTTWEVSYEVSLPDGEECEDEGDDGDDE